MNNDSSVVGPLDAPGANADSGDELSKELVPFESSVEFDEGELPEETRQLIHQNTRTLLKSITFSNSGGLRGAIERSYLIRQQSLAHSKEELVDAYKQRARLAAMVSRRRVTLQHVRAQFEALAKFKHGIRNKDELRPIKAKTDDFEPKEDPSVSFEASAPFQKQTSNSFTPIRFGSMSISDALALQQLANMRIGSNEE